MQFRNKLPLVLLLITLTMAGLANAQTVTVIAGDGLLVRPTQASTTLTVLVRNAQGQPVPGAAVNWALSGQGALASTQSTTDSTGQASNQYTAQILFGGNFATSVVTASALGVSANMNIITSGADQSNIDNTFVSVQLIAPALGDLTSGAAGSTSTTAVRAQIFAVGPTGFQGVPNVLIRLVSDTTGTTISCSGNTGYSDFNGNVNCLPVFGGQPSSARYTVEVGGGYRIFGPFNFTVTAGQVAAFRITGGNNQSGNPGAILPVSLQARVEDAAGGGLANIPVVWEPVVPGTATITNASNVSDANGNVSANVTLGTAVGAIQVRLRTQTGTVQTLFTFQVNLTVTGFTKVAGDPQEAITNSAFAQPLVVQVTTAQGPTAGLQVQFTAPAGVTLASNGVATTNAQGQASMTVTAGNNPGPVTVTAAIGGLAVSFNLSIRLPGPQINLNSFFNGAGGQPGGVSPAAILAIYGNGIATGLQGCVTGNQIVGPLSILVSNVSVLFTGAGGFQGYAPIYAVCNLGPAQQYVVVQVPAELPIGVTSVTMRVGTGQTVVDNVPVTLVSPGVFETTVYSDLQKRAVLLKEDGSYVSLENPARRGETVRAFVTGLGRPRSKNGFLIGTNQGGILGDDASPQPSIVVGVNNGGVTPTSVVYAQDLIGVYIVTFVVPADSATGPNVNFVVAASLNENLIFSNPSRFPVQ